MNKLITVAVLTLVSLALVAACTPQASVRSGERLIDMNAMEVKGSTTTAQLAAPAKNPEEISKGFAYAAPGKFDPANPTAWQVSSYMFEPSAFTVFQGDRVKIRMFIINGNKHRDRIEDPDGKIVVPEQERTRGNLYEISFMADRPGIYRMLCEEHKPTMTASITVIPKT